MSWNSRRRNASIFISFIGLISIINFQNCSRIKVAELSTPSSKVNPIIQDGSNSGELPINNYESGSSNGSGSNVGTVSEPFSSFTILDFETDKFPIAGWGTELAAVPYSAQFVNSSLSEPARSGNKSLRIELRKDDPDIANSKRAELVRMADQYLEYWFAFSIYLPADYAYDRSQESLAQWHNWPDFNLGETWMSPPLSLATNKGRWVLNRLWDDNTVSSNKSVVAKGFHSLHDLGLYESDKGRWTDWVFHIRWGWLPSQNPILEIYKNGQLVLNQNGLPNTTNDVRAPYFKLGIYKWDWKEDPLRSDISTRVIYYDRVLIGTGRGTFGTGNNNGIPLEIQDYH